jgi:hypothetical protein
VRRAVLRRRARGSTGTWDCGYAAPSARMQYTAASFADPLLRVFAPLLRTRRHTVPPDGLFPRAAALETETPDLFEESLFRPLFACAENLLSRLRVLQHGRIHAYVLVIAIVLVALLLWKL